MSVEAKPAEFLRIAHRGASGTRPELTRTAFERALEIGVDMIELDVHLTRDEHLVVVHDRELGRTLAGQGPVRERTLAELQSLDSGAWFKTPYSDQCPMSLLEVLELTRGRARLNVEIKSPEVDWARTAEVLSALLRQLDRVGDTIVSCFDMGALAALRAVDRETQLGVLWHEIDVAPAWQAAHELKAITFHPFWGIASPGVNAEAHAHGLQVLVWTVNDIARMQMLLAAGADGLMSDFPERFAEV